MSPDADVERYLKYGDILAYRVEETASTNSDVMRLAAAGEREGLLLIANRQTGGRGRRGRSFYSPEGTGIYMSMLLRPRLNAEDMMLLTPMAAVAVSEAVDSICGKHTGIKWVNDVLLDGKKICGILTEASFGQNPYPDAVAVGIGLNTVAPHGGFPAELKDIAGAIYETLPMDATTVPRLIAGIWDRFFDYYRKLPFGSFVDIYRNKQVLTGKEVRVLRPNEESFATVLGVDDRCGLLVRFADGTEQTLTSGEVSVRTLM